MKPEAYTTFCKLQVVGLVELSKFEPTQYPVSKKQSKEGGNYKTTNIKQCVSVMYFKEEK